MVKMIAIDLDGTLLNETKMLSTKNIEAITLAQSKGIEVVIATGRAYFDVKQVFKDIHLKTWVINANGACIHDPTGDLFHSVPMDKDDALQIMRWLEENEFYYEVFSKDVILTPQIGRELLAIEKDRLTSANPDINTNYFDHLLRGQFSQTGFSYIKNYKEAASPEIEIFNILAFSLDEDKLFNGWTQYTDRNDLTLVKSAKHNFELEHKDASKGIALKILASKLNIDLADTAAIGDSFNDLSMFKVVGKSAAMGNAPQEIKEACDTTTLSNKEDGVAHFIHSLID